MDTDQHNIDLKKLPKHIAIIMDGNGRWAKSRNQVRVFGHKNGVNSVREVTEACAELGVQYLTLYAFSTENWDRPKFEVNTLMKLLVDTLKKEINTLNKNDISLQAIGDLSKLPEKTRKALLEGIEATKTNSRMKLILALNYSSKWEIAECIKKIAIQYADGVLDLQDINDKCICENLETKGIPDPELMIRTSGEQRISNFLLYQLAYAELYFTETMWPDFNKAALYKAIENFQERERRFGKTSEQLKNA
ncbi:MAG TPA: isoprenyl transferase [Saprospiraceae bacterium]|nr:isoprenyl transferase [Saprospiraceae bacterium]MCB9329332.1 isoprenyl transferase [Lewinellaceae bacterium]HPQ21157.1 isoprenyl transferase [Saprospiraceae bacterium]